MKDYFVKVNPENQKLNISFNIRIISDLGASFLFTLSALQDFCKSCALFTPQPLRALWVFFHSWHLDGQAGVGDGKLVGGCRCATSWCDLDLTFDLAIVTLSLKCARS